jgi:transposase
LINTPHDPEARYSHKRGKEWLGYKAHVTETTSRTTPPVITDIRTTPATDADAPQVAPIQAALQVRGVRPRQQVVDMNYVTGQTLADSAAQHIELLGPARPDTSWQARHDGVALRQFVLDVPTHTARCPQGHSARTWQETQDAGRPVVRLTFDTATCRACPLLARCVQPGAAEPQGRRLTLSVHHERIEQRRDFQRSAAFQRQYRRRAGVEATFSLLVRQNGLRHARYRGLQKTRLQHYGIGAACNLKRCARWLAGDRPIRRTRRPMSMKVRPPSRRTVVAGG